MQLTGVDTIYSIQSALAAKLTDGSVVTWGSERGGGDSSSVQAQLKGVDKIYSSTATFVAKLVNGNLVTWGNNRYSSILEHTTKRKHI